MDISTLISAFKAVRSDSVRFCQNLELEDYCLQAEAFTSPPKWHLAHTTWFFETFILKPFKVDYQTFDNRFEYLFNSYYNSVGKQFSRPHRGLLTRPTLSTVQQYRQYVEEGMLALLETETHPERRQMITQRCQLGIQHEQQHQELLFMDIKYSFFQNPLYPPVFNQAEVGQSASAVPMTWSPLDEGLHEIGAVCADEQFAFDNESPRHQAFVPAFELADRLITNGEYLAFIEDGGYRSPTHWLADGWAWLNDKGIEQPQYWVKDGARWKEFTLAGLRDLDEHAPVCHVSAYEADAYASWAQARLPTEQEWEVAAQKYGKHVATQVHPHPGWDASEAVATQPAGPRQLFGHCWQWTGSAYRPYPGFHAEAGAIGEYNGKFMSNQWVLRGSACITPKDHARPSYRNFFYPQDRWQCSGIRLAREC